MKPGDDWVMVWWIPILTWENYDGGACEETNENEWSYFVVSGATIFVTLSWIARACVLLLRNIGVLPCTPKWQPNMIISSQQSMSMYKTGWKCVQIIAWTGKLFGCFWTIDTSPSGDIKHDRPGNQNQPLFQCGGCFVYLHRVTMYRD